MNNEEEFIQISTVTESDMSAAVPTAAIVAQAEAKVAETAAQAKLQAAHQKVLDNVAKVRGEAKKVVAKAAQKQATVAKAVAQKQAKAKLKAKSAAVQHEDTVAAKKAADGAKEKQRSADAAQDVAKAKTASFAYLHGLQTQEQKATEASTHAVEALKAEEAVKVQLASGQASAELTSLKSNAAQAQADTKTAQQDAKAVQVQARKHAKAIMVAARARTKDTSRVKVGATVSELTNEQDRLQLKENNAVQAMEKSDAADENAMIKKLQAARDQADHVVEEAKLKMRATITQDRLKRKSVHTTVRNVLDKVQAASAKLQENAHNKLQRDQQKEEAKLQVAERTAHIAKEAHTK